MYAVDGRGVGLFRGRVVGHTGVDLRVRSEPTEDVLTRRRCYEVNGDALLLDCRLAEGGTKTGEAVVCEVQEGGRKTML